MTPRPRVMTLIEILVVTAIIGVLLALLIPAVQAGREAARRSQCVGNLKMIVLAVHNYHEVHACFPPGRLNRRVDGDGACWSAHALILPYLNQSELYNELNFARAPDREPANTTALSTRLAVLICPSDFTTDPGIDRFEARHNPPPNGPQAGATYGATNYLFGTGSNQSVVAQPSTHPLGHPNKSSSRTRRSV